MVIKLATWLYTYTTPPTCSLLGAVEQAMDELQYNGDACVDDIGEAVLHNISCRRAKAKVKVKVAAVDEESRQLREAQRLMDRLAKGVVGVGDDGSHEQQQQQDEDENDAWDPPAPPPNADWLQTLDNIDALAAKVRSMMPSQ